MSTKAQCDRCKAIVEPSLFLTRIEIRPDKKDMWHVERLDLCDRCTQELQMWMKRNY